MNNLIYGYCKLSKQGSFLFGRDRTRAALQAVTSATRTPPRCGSTSSPTRMLPLARASPRPGLLLTRNSLCRVHPPNSTHSDVSETNSPFPDYGTCRNIMTSWNGIKSVLFVTTTRGKLMFMNALNGYSRESFHDIGFLYILIVGFINV